MIGLSLRIRAFVLAAALAAPCGAVWIGEASAQTAEIEALNDRLRRLEVELNALSREVYSGGGGSGPTSLTGQPRGSGAADVAVRLDQLEIQLRTVTGQAEELGYRLGRLEEQLGRLTTDLDFRLGRIEEEVGLAQADEPPEAGADVSAQSDEASAAGAGGSQQLGSLRVDAETGQPRPGPAAAGILPSGDPAEQYDYAFGLLRAADYDEAERALRSFVETHPYHQLAANAQYWLGETFYVRERYADAAIAFAEGYQKFPDGSKAPDNLLKLGMALARLERLDDACLTFRQLLAEHPEATASIRARAQEEQARIGCS